MKMLALFYSTHGYVWKLAVAEGACQVAGKEVIKRVLETLPK